MLRSRRRITATKYCLESAMAYARDERTWTFHLVIIAYVFAADVMSGTTSGPAELCNDVVVVNP